MYILKLYKNKKLYIEGIYSTRELAEIKSNYYSDIEFYDIEYVALDSKDITLY